MTSRMILQASNGVRFREPGRGIGMAVQWVRRLTQGLKPLVFACERAKAKALVYLEASQKSNSRFDFLRFVISGFVDLLVGSARMRIRVRSDQLAY
jgi:hypothetical protein